MNRSQPCEHHPCCLKNLMSANRLTTKTYKNVRDKFPRSRARRSKASAALCSTEVKTWLMLTPCCFSRSPASDQAATSVTIRNGLAGFYEPPNSPVAGTFVSRINKYQQSPSIQTTVGVHPHIWSPDNAEHFQSKVKSVDSGTTHEKDSSDGFVEKTQANPIRRVAATRSLEKKT